MKKIVIGAITLGVGLLIGGAAYAYVESRDKPEDVFQSYIRKSLTLEKFAQIQTMEGTGAKAAVNGIINTKTKELSASGSLECSGNLGNDKINLKATMSIDGQKSYVRVDSIQGKLAAGDGETYDLGSVFGGTKDKWYEISAEDVATKSQIDSGVFVSNSMLIAPGYDSGKISKSLIDSGAFSYKAFKKDGKNYVYEFVSNKSAYLTILKEQFPNLRNADLILDGIYIQGNTMESTVTVDSKGNLINEKLTIKNECAELVEAFTGEAPINIAKESTGVANVVGEAAVKIEKPINPKSIQSISEDFSF